MISGATTPFRHGRTSCIYRKRCAAMQCVLLPWMVGKYQLGWGKLCFGAHFSELKGAGRKRAPQQLSPARGLARCRESHAGEPLDLAPAIRDVEDMPASLPGPGQPGEARKIWVGKIRYSVSGAGGLIIICARWVPGSISQGAPGVSGFRGRPVLSGVAQGIYTTAR